LLVPRLQEFENGELDYMMAAPKTFLCALSFAPLFLVGACVQRASIGAEISEGEAEQIRGDMSDALATSLTLVHEQLANSDYLVALEQQSELSKNSLALTSPANLKKSVSDFDQQIRDLWSKSGKSVCNVLRPYLDFAKKNLNHPYFFVGQSAQAGVIAQGIVGRDYVWDLFNLQFSAFDYQGKALVMGGGSVDASVSTYLGAAVGTMPDVEEAWSGRFVSSAINAGLPIVSAIASVGASGFVSADQDGRANNRLFGSAVAFNLSLPDPTGLPVGVAVQNAHWKINASENHKIAKLFTKYQKLKIATSGIETCFGRCLRFDAIDYPASYRGRALTLIMSIPLLASQKASTLFLPTLPSIALTAMAVATLRDERNGTSACTRTPTLNKFGF
jgi:hypothetical protein